MAGSTVEGGQMPGETQARTRLAAADEASAGRRAFGLRALAIAAVVVLLAIAAAVKLPCVSAPGRQIDYCRTQIPTAYLEHGLARSSAPFGGRGADAVPFHEPALVALLEEATGLLTHAIHQVDAADYAKRSTATVAELTADPAVLREAGTFFWLNAGLLSVAAVAAMALLQRMLGSLRWFRGLACVAPLMVLESFEGWHWIGILALVTAVWAWRQRKLVLTGALLGIGAAAAPAVAGLGLALVAIAVNRRRPRVVLLPLVTAVVAWVALNAPWLALQPTGWLSSHLTTVIRPSLADPEQTSIWRYLRPGLGEQPGLIPFMVCGGALVATVIALVWFAGLARRPAGLTSYGLIALAILLVTTPSYLPADALLLLPLALLTNRRLSLLAAWVMAELANTFASWPQLYHRLVGADEVIGVGTAIRVLGQLGLVVVVVTLLLRPRSHHR